jgi:large subunit ribosomal protein L9
VTAADIADAIKDARGFTVDKRKVLLEEPIQELGTFQVDVELAEGFVASVKTIVVVQRDVLHVHFLHYAGYFHYARYFVNAR